MDETVQTAYEEKEVVENDSAQSQLAIVAFYLLVVALTLFAFVMGTAALVAVLFMLEQ